MLCGGCEYTVFRLTIEFSIAFFPESIQIFFNYEKHESHEINLAMIRVFRSSSSFIHISFLFNFGMMAEIDQQAKPFPGCLQIIDHLGSVLIIELFNRLDLQYDFIKTQEIRFIGLPQFSTLVIKPDPGFLSKWDFPHRKFKRQAFLVDRLKKPISFVCIYLEASPDNSITLLFEDNSLFHFSCLSRVS